MGDSVGICQERRTDNHLLAALFPRTTPDVAANISVMGISAKFGFTLGVGGVMKTGLPIARICDHCSCLVGRNIIARSLVD